jgi:hypothetical protein
MDKKIILYVVLGVVILALLLFTFFPGIVHAVKDSGITGNTVEDKCSPAPGYTEETWREHMSHHPNIYSECLT